MLRPQKAGHPLHDGTALTAHHLTACPMRAINLLGGAVETSCDRLWATCCRRCSRGMPPYTSLQKSK